METRILVVNATPGGASAEGDGGAHADGEKTSGMSNGDSKAKGKAKAQGGMRGGYVGLMNCVFAAQKAVSVVHLPRGVPSLTIHWQKVPIDVLTLPPPHTHTSPPIFLQQAAHLTEGIYWRWNGRGGLLQYLHVSQCFRRERSRGDPAEATSGDLSTTTSLAGNTVCCATTGRRRL